MKKQEAINELKRIRPAGAVIPQRRAEAIDIAIEALEKQIPKKPTEVFDKTDLLTDYFCPSCGIAINKWCGCDNNDCNQKIDWSEVE